MFSLRLTEGFKSWNISKEIFQHVCTSLASWISWHSYFGTWNPQANELNFPINLEHFDLVCLEIWHAESQQISLACHSKSRSGWLQPKQQPWSLWNNRTSNNALMFIRWQLTARWRCHLTEEINVWCRMAQSVAVHLIRRHMSSDMTKIARHFVAVNKAPLRRDRDRQRLWL